MKLLKITTFYPDYLRNFYRDHPGVAERSYTEQKAALDHDAFGWADYWSHALSPLGYEVMEITYNAAPLQFAWAREHGSASNAALDLDKIALAQAKSFRPDILWLEDYNAVLLNKIKLEVPSIRLTMGWVGSAIPRTDVWRHLDVILSCAPESVDYFQMNGLPGELLHHGFDPRINDRVVPGAKQFKFTFIGQLIRVNQFHLQREQMLVQLATHSGIDIFSPSAELGWKNDLRYILKTYIYGGVKALRAAGVPDSTLSKLPVIGKVSDLKACPLQPVNPVLKPFLRPGVFGLKMFQVLHDSMITLNIHADSSPLFASNMRLFETTGVGTCMVTDWKDNLPNFFTPDIEVITYRSADECAEKVTWLLEHPKERDEIARAGQARTLRDHTFARRAAVLNDIIRRRMGIAA